MGSEPLHGELIRELTLHRVLSSDDTSSTGNLALDPGKGCGRGDEKCDNGKLQHFESADRKLVLVLRERVGPGFIGIRTGTWLILRHII